MQGFDGNPEACPAEEAKPPSLDTKLTLEVRALHRQARSEPLCTGDGGDAGVAV